MEKYKYALENICAYEYKYAERHLEEMAKDGWMLESTGLCFWKYRKIEPQAKKFSVTYLPGGSPFDPEITEEEEQLKEYCSEAGWYKVADWGIMKIFANDEENPVPIDTDEKLRFEAYKASKGKDTLLGAITNGLDFFKMLFAAAFCGLLLLGNPLWILGNLTMFLCTMFLMLALIVTSAYGLSYLSWMEASEEQIKQGGTCIDTKGPGVIRKVGPFLLLVIMITLLLTQIAGGAVGRTIGIVIYAFWLIAVAFLGYKLFSFMRKKDISRKINIAVIIMFLTLAAYINYQWVWDIPAKMQQYNAVETVGTPWLCAQNGELKVEGKQVEYESYEVRSKGFWDFCVEKSLDDECKESDAAVWGADKAYTFIPTEYEEGEVIGDTPPEYAGSYLLLKDNYIVWVGLSEDMENKKAILDAVLDAI